MPSCCWFSFFSYCFCCFLSAAWSQPLAIDGFHHHLVLLQYLFRLCLLVLTVFHLLDLPVLNIFPPVPFPCFSQVSKPSSSESLSCQAAAKAFFSLLSLQIDFSASKYCLTKTFCCLPWTFLLLPLPTLKWISPLCLMSLQQPQGIQEAPRGSGYWLCCSPVWHARSKIHLLWAALCTSVRFQGKCSCVYIDKMYRAERTIELL